LLVGAFVSAWSRTKSIAGWLFVAAIPFVMLSEAYGYGYNRGYRHGAVDMRDAIMCVVERTASIQPYKYCAEQTAARLPRNNREAALAKARGES
jgi:hypothetical protein